ncbi:hypothetical protein, partial [Pseudomonas mosselii]|uniref:hypothetical protein n=1 Tax=Pseudomonas mosselii TaxID=78327 RepID=UPI003F31B27E
DYSSPIISDSRTPLLYGYIGTGKLVRVFEGDVEIGGASFIFDDGHFTFKPSTQLSVGTHELRFYAYEPNGEISSAKTFTYTVKSAGTRAAPFTTDLFGDVDGVADSIVNGATSDERKPLIEEASNSVAIGDHQTDIRSIGMQLEADAGQDVLLNMNVLSTIIDSDSHEETGAHLAEAETMLIDGPSLNMDVLIERLVEEKAPELDGVIEPDVEGDKSSAAAPSIDDMPEQWTDSALTTNDSLSYNQPSAPLELPPVEVIQTNVM